jgi:hypothetical protein
MKYKIDSVTDFEIQGINIDRKSQLGDFTPSELLKLIPAFSSGKLYTSFILNILVENPNPTKYISDDIDLKITNFPWQLFVNGNKILEGNIMEPINLNGEVANQKIPIRIQLNLADIIKKGSIDELLQTVLKFGGKNSSTSNIELLVKPEIGTIFGRISAPNPIKIVDYEFR